VDPRGVSGLTAFREGFEHRSAKLTGPRRFTSSAFVHASELMKMEYEVLIRVRLD